MESVGSVYHRGDAEEMAEEERRSERSTQV